MGRRIRRTNRRSNLRRVRKNTMKRKSMKRKTMKRKTMKRRNTLKRRNNKRNTMRRKNSRRNFRWMRGGMQAAPAAPAAPTAVSLDTYDQNGINLVRFGKTGGNKKKLVEIGSKPLFNDNMMKNSIEELLSGASAVYVPSELKSEKEPASNFRSTDARISGAGSSEDGTWSTTTNDTLIENIIKLIQSSVPYYQTALPRGARVLKEGAVSFTGDYTTTEVNNLNSRGKPAIASCVNPEQVEELLIPILKTVEERGDELWGIPDLKTATAGAYNCTMLSDVFSFIALVNLAMEDKRYIPYFAPRNIVYKENSSATVDGKASGKGRPDGGKSNEKRTFRCIHFYDAPDGYPLTDYVQDEDMQAGVVKILYDDFLQFLSTDPDTAFKNKVKNFFDNYYIERLSDNFHNDIDDDLLFVLLMRIGIPIENLMRIDEV